MNASKRTDERTVMHRHLFASMGISAWLLVCPPGASAASPEIEVVTESTTVNGVSNVHGHRYSWQDEGGEIRSALMLDQTANRAGVLRQLKYKVAGADRVCTAIPSNGNAIQGMGYVVNHLGTGTPWGNWTAGVKAAVGGTTTTIFKGRHHVIIQYTISNYTLNGKAIPTSVQWMFATGRTHPLFCVTQDARAHTAGNLGGDSRSPYGTLQFAGDGLPQDCLIGGVAWGDTYKFVTVQSDSTHESTTLTAASGWRYNQPNTIPFTMAWASGVNAEQGTVATTSIARQDQGSDPRIYPQTGFQKNQQDLNGPMILGDDWQFQMMNYPDIPVGGTYDKKIGWGTNFGMLGGFDNWGDTSLTKTEYSRHRDSVLPWTGSRASALFLAYSTFIVLGEHTGGYLGGPTGQMVSQMEATQEATLTATVGQIKTQGPASHSIGDSPVVTFSPVGYDAFYAAWTVTAAADSAVSMTLTPAAAKPVTTPVFRISNYQASSVISVRINGVLAQSDVDYFASLDSAKHELWLTLNRNVSSASTITLEKISQTITFARLPSKTLGDAPIALSSSASSGLEVAFASSDAAVAIVSGSTLTITGVGTAVITASQAGNENYAAAENITQTLIVSPPPYQQWKAINGLPVDAADKADPDRDGILTLMEYALACNPTVPNALPVTITTSGSYLALSASKNSAASDINWSAEVSGDLLSWSPATITLDTHTQFGAADTVPISGAATRFIRLRITHP